MDQNGKDNNYNNIVKRKFLSHP